MGAWGVLEKAAVSRRIAAHRDSEDASGAAVMLQVGSIAAA